MWGIGETINQTTNGTEQRTHKQTHTNIAKQSLTKGTKAIQWRRKIVFSTNGAGTTGQLHAKKNLDKPHTLKKS